MHAASSMNTQPTTRKAARRSPRWTGGHPHRAAKRTVRRTEDPTIIRFPIKPEASALRERESDADVARKMHEVRAAWSEQEKERRRIQAAAKQQELLMLL